MSVRGREEPGIFLCSHRSEVGDLPCLLRAGHDAHPQSPHSYGNCSYCEFAYDPCEHHDPTAHAEHKAREDAQREKVVAARKELRDRKDELPDWAREAVELVTW